MESRGSPKRLKIKSGCIGGSDKTVDMQPKTISPEFFHTNGVLASKNTLKPPPPRTILKKGGGGVLKPLVVSDFSEPALQGVRDVGSMLSWNGY